MGRYSSIPTLHDECKTISISFLKSGKYLEPDGWKTGTLTWSRGEGQHKRITASISIEVNTQTETPYLALDYKTNDKPINYKVWLISIPSNIGKGVVWFFVCPNTGKRCRKLYLIGSYFLHRSAFQGAMYEKQTYSKNGRQQIKIWSNLFDTDSIYERITANILKGNMQEKRQSVM